MQPLWFLRGGARRRPSSFGRLLAHRKALSSRRRPLALESLESRLVLDVGPVVIGEFLAINDGGRADEDGESSDWIELHNPTDARVSLDGWYLTDDSGNLTKWQLPDVSLEAGAYRLVFASGKDRRNPTGELHANFQLDGDGEYLALVRADGTTIASQFAPEYPKQRENVSYGASGAATPFRLEGSGVTYHVPTSADAALGMAWTETRPIPCAPSRQDGPLKDG